jgi:hypothetical protein
MEEGGGECRLEYRERRKLIFGRAAILQEKGKSDEQGEQEGEEERVGIRATPGEESGRTDPDADNVEIGEGAGQEHGERCGTRDAGKGGALEGVGGESMSEEVHRAEKLA